MSIIQWWGLSLAFAQKTCFSDFSGRLHSGQRIAVVGDNGSGKSSLLRLLCGELEPTAGRVERAPGLAIGYLPQVMGGATALSGAERVNRALSHALAGSPDLLLLDEPSNHLDAGNRRAMLRMLRNFEGALVMVTHDLEWMDALCDTLWIFDEGRIEVFAGRYRDYLAEREAGRAALVARREALKRENQALHARLMKEQTRASHARARGEKAIREHRWPTVKSAAKLGRGNATAGGKRAALRACREDVSAELARLAPNETIDAAFFLSPAALRANGPVVQVSGGLFGFSAALTAPLHLTIEPGEQLWLCGANGSGKSTLARALAGEAGLRLGGDWSTPAPEDVGYLDQQYANLPEGLSVHEALRARAPDWDESALRHHLSRFLFRSEAAVTTPVDKLSGGERARLSLACIAARTPRLLILDEVGNNLDLRARAQVVQVLRAYPGACLLISHDPELMRQLPAFRRVDLPPAGP